MKVGILTMHRVKNFGSVCQAYALQRTLYKLGIDNEIIDYQFPNCFHASIYGYKRYIFIIKCILSEMLLKKRKEDIFDTFIKNHMKLSIRKYNYPLQLRLTKPRYDIYMAGSDQIWNNRWMMNDKSFFLPFVKNKAKKVSYASSFGSIYGSEEEITKWIYPLKRFSHISVRENRGKEIIKSYIGMDSTVVLDPTLLLDKEEWIKLIPDNYSLTKQERPYILVYILNYAWYPYPYAEDVIDYYATKTGYDVKVLYKLENPQNHPNYETIGIPEPSEFIRLINGAKLVITTSFHGTSFSINLNVPFFAIVNNKKTNDDRISSLLNILGLSDRALTCGVDIPEDFNMDFGSANNKLTEERKKSVEYIKNCLNT